MKIRKHHRKTKLKRVRFWLPKEALPILDQMVRKAGITRSELFRRAVREKLRRAGIEPAG